MGLNSAQKQDIQPESVIKGSRDSILPQILFAGSVVFMLAALYFIFLYANIDKTLGVVQKIFYFHVSSAWVAFLAYFVTFIYSILFLVKRKRIFDTYAHISAEIGVAFTTIVLTTGPIWAKSSWNTWWVWEPRLTTTLILWFIYVGYIMIRQMDSTWDKKARLCSVFGIIGFVDVPIVFFAIRWWTTKFHPIVFGNGVDQTGGGIDSTMMVALLSTIVALTFFYTYLLNRGVSLENMRIKVDQYKEKLREKLDK